MATSNQVDETDYPMRTRKFREIHQDLVDQLQSKGIKYHVGHIIAKNNGGADDTDNYLLVPGIFNSRIQDKWDPLMCNLAGLEQTKAAIRCSPGCGLTENDAQRMVQEGKELWFSYSGKYGRDYPDGGQGEEQDPTEEYPDTLDGDRLLEDEAYCDWVIAVWNHGVANTEG